MTLSNRGKRLIDESGVSRRQALKIGAQGIGLGILSGVSPLPPMFTAASTALAATPGKILVVFDRNKPCPINCLRCICYNK